MNMFGETQFLTDSFKTLYLEDYFKLKEEAELLRIEAEENRLAGDDIAYMEKLKQYDVYNLTADTMLSLAIKTPVAEA
jgi:hypothetical protein